MSLLNEFEQYKKDEGIGGIGEQFSAFQTGQGNAGSFAENAVKEKGFIEDSLGDIKDFGVGVVESLGKRASEIGRIAVGEKGVARNPLESGILATGEVAGAVGDVIGEGLKGLGKLFVSEETEQEVKDKFTNFIETSGAGEALQGGYEAWQGFKKNHPRTAELVEAGANIADAFLEATGAGIVGKTVREGVETGVKTGLRTGDEILTGAKSKLFGKQVDKPTDIDNLVKKSEELLTEKPLETSQDLLRVAEDTAPKTSILEKWAGIRPDIKKRIEGKQEKLQSYFNVANASNLDDMLPTVYDLANQSVKKAEKGIMDQLDDVGSKIGQVRRKLSTTKVAISKIDDVIATFDDELAKLNLTTNNKGQIIQDASRATAVGTGEKRVLNELRDNLVKMKQNPTIDGVIDNRIIFDDRINFAKRGSDVSGRVDPISRKVRGQLAEINAETVGKTNAGDLKEYSLAKEAQKQLESFTKRKAGSEYLLRLVLSGRGREAKEIVEVIKKLTGIDLMDDATMLQLAVELIGNDRSKNLFRQEVKNAGLDALNIFTGGKTGVVKFLFEKSGIENVKQKALEKTFLKASESPKVKDTPTPKNGNFERGEGLTGENLEIETKAFNRIVKDEEKMLKQYNTTHGKVVNTDNFRPFFTKDGYNGTNAHSVQEPSSYLAKKAFTKELTNPQKFASFFAGGSGSGKTSAIKGIGKLSRFLDKSAVVLDSNLSSIGSATKKLKEAQDAGKVPVIFYAYRDPVDSFVNGVVARMKNNIAEGGRIVPSKVTAGNHIDSWDVVKKLDDDGYKVVLIDNSLGLGKQKTVSVEEMSKKIKYPSTEELTDIFNKEAKKLLDSGDLTPEQYKAYIT